MKGAWLLALALAATPAAAQQVYRSTMSDGRIGCMTTPAQGNVIPPGAWYACDNGKFGCDGKGRNWPGLEEWRYWLERTVTRYGPDLCLWALAPDVPFNAQATLTLQP